MIAIDQLTEADIGRNVIYETHLGQEVGKLTSWNKTFIFVQFRGPNGEACRPEDVSFEFEACTCEICAKPVPDYKPQYCCSGHECGCYGRPLYPCICSSDCWDALMNGETAEERRKT